MTTRTDVLGLLDGYDGSEFEAFEVLSAQKKCNEESGILKPVRGLRRIQPRCCATCRWFGMADGTGICVRPNGPEFDAGDLIQWISVCDLYQSEAKQAEGNK